MMKYALALLFLLIAFPAFAEDDAVRIGKQAQACWMIPGELADKKLSATLHVDLDANGEVRAITAPDAPKDEQMAAFVASARRALLHCAPYRGLSQTALIVHFNSR